MKKVLILAVFASAFACSKKAKDPAPAPTEITKDTVIAADQAHTSRNSLDYLGLYKGMLPCADCPGIETTIQLSEDFSYVLTRKYVGRNVKPTEEKGTFRWNRTGNAIVLSGGAPNQYLVGENTLTQLDADGKKIEGAIAPKLVLKKMTEAQAAKTDAAPADAKPAPLTGVHWRLAELDGKPVKGANGKADLYVEFKPDNNFTAFAGCNHIGGHYDFNGSKMKFMRIMATMMACPEMAVEDGLKKALEQADNFVANEKVLQLRKGGTTLAKFDARLEQAESATTKKKQ
jgi:uncharacterized lipoprotein NlpE involved in copper resistance